MKLRTRLIVAFLLLSVVPLGVVTFYSYSSNVDAMQDVATREADLLAGQLSERMQLVTAKLSDAVEHLMEVPQPVTQVAVATSAPAAKSDAAKPEAAKPAVVETEQFNQQVAKALGEAAILLNSVQMQPSRGFSRGDGRGSGSGAGSRSQSEAGSLAGTTSATGSRSGQPLPPGTRQTGAPTPPPSAAPSAPPSATPTAPPVKQTFISPPGAPPGTPPSSARGSHPPGPGGPGTITFRFAGSGPGGAGPPAGTAQTAEGTQIDLSQIRRDLYRQILPNGSLETLTPEERQRVAREVNLRMLGIVEGIKLSAIELQKKADQARLGADAATKATPESAKAPVAPLAPVPPPAPPALPIVTTTTTGAASKRTSELSGNRLNVQVMQNGQVVRAANAEINLPALLLTVFSTMPREQGELPFAVDKDGKVYARSDEDRKKVEELGSVAKANGPLGKTVLPGWIVVTTAEPSGSGLRFGIARPTGDSLRSLRQAAGRNAAFGLLFIGVALALVAPLSTRLTKNLSKLTDGVKRIANGDYRARVEVSGGDEVGALAAAFNQMAEDVERHQRSAVEQERIRRELELGRQIQHDMQPHGALRLGLTEITGASVSASEVGGDFFNYFELSTGHLAMLVGDVSGKGVGAALLMANIQASLRTRLALGQDLKAVAEEIDREVEANTPGPVYSTLFISILDPATRMLRYVNAGHNPQFVLRRQGGLERMSSTGMPIGLLAGRGHKQLEVQLAEGDRLFFYTDGCVEAENERREQFGAERLETALQALPSAATPQEVLVHIERAIEQFRGSRELFDDVTVMAVRVG
jgi:serine phosphatase RsbU (regulator of sigma subunit)